MTGGQEPRRTGGGAEKRRTGGKKAGEEDRRKGGEEDRRMRRTGEEEDRRKGGQKEKTREEVERRRDRRQKESRRREEQKEDFTDRVTGFGHPKTHQNTFFAPWPSPPSASHRNPRPASTPPEGVASWPETTQRPSSRRASCRAWRGSDGRTSAGSAARQVVPWGEEGENGEAQRFGASQTAGQLLPTGLCFPEYWIHAHETPKPTRFIGKDGAFRIHGVFGAQESDGVRATHLSAQLQAAGTS